MDIATARDILKRKPVRFGNAEQIAADRFVTESVECEKWLTEKSGDVMMAALKTWFQTLDTCGLVELENMLWTERKSRRGR